MKEEKDKCKDVGIYGCDCHACRRQARNDKEGKKIKMRAAVDEIAASLRSSQ